MTPFRRHILRGALACAAALPLAGPALAQAAAPQTLTVSAAASMTNALKEIGRRFAADQPDVTLQYNFAASGVLIQQIAQGAPVDVFISADQETLKKGIDQKLLDPQTQRDFAANSLVLITPAGPGAPIAALKDLAGDAVQKIAIGKPATVPAGRYTRQALEHHQLWAAVEPKLVFADSVRQVLDYVARGEVDAGFVYRTDAALMPDKVKVVLQSDEHQPIRYPVAVVFESRQKALARRFIDFLFTPAAQQVLAGFGFGKP